MRRLTFLAVLALFGTAISPLTGAAAEPVTVTESLRQRLQGARDSWLGIIVQFDSEASRLAADLPGLGAHVVYQVQSIPAAFAWATPAMIEDLRRLEGVTLIEHNDPIEYDMDTAVVAGNAMPLWGVPAPNLTANGKKIDGAGVTVAVVDTGVNAFHPDLKRGAKVVKNLMAVGVPTDPNRDTDPFTGGPGGVLKWEEVDDGDGGGHGSHVAGIVAGSGQVGSLKYRGSAPGASLVGLGSQFGSFWYAVAAWDWVFQNHNKVSPPIRIVTNSWGYDTGVPCDPAISLTKIEKRLVLEAHVAMFFSAGNTGGKGDKDNTRTQFKCPWEGIIGVANYDDKNTGTRDHIVATGSSRGDKKDPKTWPDIAAPGSNITATNGDRASAGGESYYGGCHLYLAANQAPPRCYTVKSGTSMATPFAAGVGALVLQARPDLKPADLEYILERTAYKVGGAETYHVDDKDYRHNGSHHYRGHGLVDAEAAVRFALSYDASEHLVVYGENEVPLARAPPLGGLHNSAGTPGLGPIALLAVLVGISFMLVRRSRT